MMENIRFILLLLTLNSLLCPNEARMRIVGGSLVSAGEFPFYVWTSGTRLCGGSIIWGDFVLTAAHCFQAFNSSNSVRHGSITRFSGTLLPIDRLISHPDFDSDTMENDVMLVKLKNYSSLLRKVSLNSDRTIPVEGASITGMGYGSDGVLDTVRNMQKVNMPSVSYNICNETYHDMLYDEEMTCTGGTPEGGKDTCVGDSGGPMMLQGTLIQIGIVSWGAGCAEPDTPGVNSRVSTYVAWILEQVCTYSNVTPPWNCPPKTATPIFSVTMAPLKTPTVSPVHQPTIAPLRTPTNAPRHQPTQSPIHSPSTAPIAPPTRFPIRIPTVAPTNSPTAFPIHNPNVAPSISPSRIPVKSPTVAPTNSPTAFPIHIPTLAPSKPLSIKTQPSQGPAHMISVPPAIVQINTPTTVPVRSPSIIPVNIPSFTTPLQVPRLSGVPVSQPSIAPAQAPSITMPNTPTVILIPIRVRTNVPQRVPIMARKRTPSYLDAITKYIVKVTPINNKSVPVQVPQIIRPGLFSTPITRPMGRRPTAAKAIILKTAVTKEKKRNKRDKIKIKKV